MTSVTGERDVHSPEVEARAAPISAGEVRDEPATAIEERRRNASRSDRRESFRIGGRRADDL
jgi:hypothetical protein